MALLKQSTSQTRLFLMVSSTDHITGKTGIVPTVTLSKAGAAFGGAAGTVTEIASGWYKIVLTTVDTNTLGDLAFHCTGSGADPSDFVDQVSARVFDDYAFPATKGRSLAVDVNGVVDANLVQILATALTETAGQIAAAFKKFFDIASPLGTTNSIPSVTAIGANGITAASVAPDVTDEIWNKACTEPTSVVTSAPSAISALSWLLSFARNKITQTATAQTIYADDGVTIISSSSVSDDGTTFTRSKYT